MSVLKLEVTPVIIRQILEITKGDTVPFFLRKKAGENTLEIIFYTRARTVKGKAIKPVVSVGWPEGFKRRKYYLLDKDMNATELSASGRGRDFTIAVK